MFEKPPPSALVLENFPFLGGLSLQISGMTGKTGVRCPLMQFFGHFSSSWQHLKYLWQTLFKTIHLKCSTSLYIWKNKLKNTTVESFKLHIMSKSSINSRYVQKTATRGGPRADPGFFHGIFGHFSGPHVPPGPTAPGFHPHGHQERWSRQPFGGREGGFHGRKGISYRSLVVSTNQPTLKKPLKST